MPKPRRSGGRGSRRSSSSQISPALGASSPASRLRAVDLPQPEGPRKVTNSPPRTSSAKSSRTFFAPKCLLSRKRRRPIIPLELLDALRADLLVPAVHGRDQLLHRQLRDDLVLLVHVRVLRPPVLGDELLDVRRRMNFMRSRTISCSAADTPLGIAQKWPSITNDVLGRMKIFESGGMVPSARGFMSHSMMPAMIQRVPSANSLSVIAVPVG